MSNNELKKSIPIKTYNQTKKTLKGIISRKEADLYEANNRIVDLMNIIDERDKIIDLMANEIYIEHNPHFNTVEDVKKYFEERCK